jgi:hypothetical protein
MTLAGLRKFPQQSPKVTPHPAHLAAGFSPVAIAADSSALKKFAQ